MTTTLMDNIITSGTTMLTDTVGALFTYITAILPVLLALVALGFVVWGIKWIIRKMKHVR